LGHCSPPSVEPPLGVTRFAELICMWIISLEIEAKQMRSIRVQFFSLDTIAFLVLFFGGKKMTRSYKFGSKEKKSTKQREGEWKNVCAFCQNQTYFLCTHLRIKMNKFPCIFFEINISFRICFTKMANYSSKELMYRTHSISELQGEKFDRSLLFQLDYSEANVYTLPIRNRKSKNELFSFYLWMYYYKNEYK